jgi:ribosomal-protein-alanine N-acetyltransferase
MKRSLGNGYSIRSFEDSDIPAIAKYANNRNIWINLTNKFPYPYTEADAQIWIQHVKTQEIETNFAIASKEESIGGIGFELQADVHRKSAMLGYWLGQPYWGKGITTRAVCAITEYAFTHHDLVRIYAGVFAYNLASARVLEKAGYICEGRLRKSVFKDGKSTDMLVYAILREEWQTSPVYKQL